MREFPAQDVGEDLGVAVGVGGEAGGRGDAVFVQDAQGAEGGVKGVVVGGEGEGVVGVEPAVGGVAAGGGGARGYFHGGGGVGGSRVRVGLGVGVGEGGEEFGG